jgi:glutaminyl-peptide cyclotransferase
MFFTQLKTSFIWLCLALGLIILSSCAQNQNKTDSLPPLTNSKPPVSTPTFSPSQLEKIPTYSYRIVEVFPHDSASYTEGLAYNNGLIYESSGLYGLSDLHETTLETGRAIKVRKLPDAYFAEGIAIYQNEIIQLTWKSKLGFVYNLETFTLNEVFTYDGEGWGLTCDGEQLIKSDGTDNLSFWDPRTLQAFGSLQVTDSGKPIDNLNELEFVKGEILANIWQTDKIAIINPRDGKVTSWLDLTGLLQSSGFKGEADVLNGIAYDSQNDRLFVTGKLWPYLFEIRIIK